MIGCWKILLPCWLMAACCQSANILGIATYDGNSHWLVMQAVFNALANAGHQVTVITPNSKSTANVSLIDISKSLPPRRNAFTFDFIRPEYERPYLTLNVLPSLSLGQCDKAHRLPEVRRLLNGERKFDVVISEVFGTDCDAVFAYLLKVPLISVVTSAMLPWASYRVGNPENPSYVPNILLPYAGPMSFDQRLINTFYNIYTYFVDIYSNYRVTSMNRKHFGNEVPSAQKIFRNTSLVFVNSHFTVDQPRPFVPNVIEVGGIHLPPVKPLPKDWATFMDNSSKGVIFFSLGSIIQASSLPNETITAFKEAFAELDLNVLWKFEDESLDVPSNVIIRKWFPQRDLLAHPNMKLAIMHGGLMGVYEAVDVGLPVIGLPIFFDQRHNVANLVAKGSAIQLDLHRVTKENFLENIKKIIHDKSYKQRADKLSKKFHDRLVKPSDSVVYWTEYVINHEGAYHLRSAAAELPWYQYILLDVILFLFFTCFLVLFVMKKIIQTLVSTCRRLITTNKVVSPASKPTRNGIHLKTT
ncbi:UDP-glucosyltransferase 2-like [Planococcus citri]|uniref:UDP-glucosyltransferase 2-like n=1 Tax=Planococcus citri TaxID=170843 RepID=UPI0031F87425